MKPTDKPPPLLLDAFRASESVTDIAPLLADEGFDTVTVRVLSSWERTTQAWKRPRKPCPDDGRPTNAAWEWLTSGWTIDVRAIAAAASVSLDVARDRSVVLVAARLIYPDGTMSKVARQAMQATIAARLVRAGGKQKAEPKPEKKDDKKAN